MSSTDGDYTEAFAPDDARRREGPRFGAAGVFAGQGRPAYGLIRRVRIAGRPVGNVEFGVGLAILTWLPLLCLVMLDCVGPGLGEPGSFLASINTHVRFLVDDPARVFCRGVDRSAPHFAWIGRLRSRDRDRERGAHAAVASRTASGLRDGRVGVAILALTLVQLELSPLHAARRRLVLAIDRRRDGRAADMGGWWYGLVALPVYQFLIYRWSWRLLTWAVFLWRLSRIRLHLVPTHPDLAGDSDTSRLRRGTSRSFARSSRR